MGSAVGAGSGIPITFPAADHPLVSVVMCAKDARDLTLAALRALLRNTPEGVLQVVLVDDGSGAEAREAFAQIKGIDFVRHDVAQGFLHSSNRGLQEVRGDITCFLNNDTEVQSGWLEPVLRAFEDPSVGAVGSRLINPDGSVQESGVTIWSDGSGHAHGSGGGVRDEEWCSATEVDYCSGAALCVRTELVRRAGGFDPRFAPAFYEDVDLCFQVRRMGHRVVVAPESKVLHHGGQSYGAAHELGQRMSPGRLQQFANRPVFQAKWAAELRRWHLPSGSPAGLVPFVARSRPRILIVDAWIPAHDRDAGSLRMTWIARLLTQLGVDVTLWATGGPERREYADALRRDGIEVWLGFSGFHYIERRANLWDIVMVSRPDVGAEVLYTIREHCSRAPLVYDTVDVHHVRMMREAAVTGEVPATFEEIRYYEELMCTAADVVVTVSDADAQHLRAMLGTLSPEFIVLPIVQEPWPHSAPGFDERDGLLFIGGYRHVPNQDAARWFAHEVWPAMASPALPVTLLGDEPTDEVLALSSSHGFDVPGFRDDVTADFDAARVFICPLRFGSGVKGKILHALAAGLPVVTTSVGLEGMTLEPGVDVLVADTPAEFADAVNRLHADSTRWEGLSARGRAAAQAWSPEAMRDRLDAMLSELLSPREYRSLRPRTP